MNKGHRQRPLYISRLVKEGGATLASALYCLLHAPLFNLGMVAAEEHVRDTPASEFGRAGVFRRRDKTVLEGVGKGGLLVANNTGNEADDGVGNNGSGKFATRKDIVADGDFHGDEVFADALVDSLVMSAENHEVLFQGEGVGHGLGEHLTVRGSIDDFVVPALAFQPVDAVGKGFDCHDHARAATIGIVVYAAIAGEGIVVKIVEDNFDKAFFLSPANDGLLEEHGHHVGEEGEDVETHDEMDGLSEPDGAAGFKDGVFFDAVELAETADGGAVALGNAAEGVASAYLVGLAAIAVVAHARLGALVGIATLGHLSEGVAGEAEIGLDEGAGLAADDVLGVHGVAVVADFEVEVAATGASCVAAKAYLLACTDAGAGGHMALGEVGIIGFESVVVADDDKVAVGRVVFGETHHAVKGGIDGFAGGHGKVEAVVEATTTGTEVGGWTCIVRRGEDEEFAMVGVGEFDLDGLHVGDVHFEGMDK